MVEQRFKSVPFVKGGNAVSQCPHFDGVNSYVARDLSDTRQSVDH